MTELETHGRRRELIECYIVECPDCGKQAALGLPEVKGIRPPECADCDKAMTTIPEKR